jgi:hypothetical protein
MSSSLFIFWHIVRQFRSLYHKIVAVVQVPAQRPHKITIAALLRGSKTRVDRCKRTSSGVGFISQGEKSAAR